MADEKQPPGELKIVDRRRFTADGEIRSDVEASPASQAAPETIISSNPTGASETKRQTPPLQETARLSAPEYPQAGLGSEPGVFEALLASLSTTAMLQMGLMKGPSGEPVPADLEAAHQTIDMLETLEKKTRGNLTTQEQAMLTQLLYELRMAFVEISGGLSPVQPGPDS